MGAKKKARSSRRKERKMHTSPSDGASSFSLALTKILESRKNPNKEQQLPIHPQDNLNKLLERLHRTKDVDMRSLAKFMPHAVKDLREGKLEPLEFATSIVYYEYTERYQFPSFVWLANKQAEKATLMAFSCVPGHPMLPCKEYLDFFVHLFRSWMMNLSLKLAVDATCEQWSSRFEKELGCADFLKNCSVYNVGVPELREMLKVAEIDAERDLIFLRQRFQTAAMRLVGGARDVHRICWECGVSNETLMKCTKCSCALYCSLFCQAVAWRDGHKRSCPRLRSVSRLLDESIRAIDAMHTPTSGGSTAHPSRNLFSRAMDYELLRLLPDADGADGLTELDGPSMVFFYKNFPRS
jgi:MYND finger